MRKLVLLEILVILLAVLCLLSCKGVDFFGVDLPQIKAKGELEAIVTYSATSYFLYRGEPMGFDYELLQRFADELDLDLKIIIARDLDEMIAMLQAGKGDLIAHGLTITKERKKEVAFTQYLHKTHQVIVQRKPDNWRQMKLHEIERELIRDPNDLINKKVHVRKMSSYYQRLLHLSEEIGGDIDIQIASGDLTTETLIRQVAEGKISFTVADHNIAFINSTYYDNLDVRTKIGMSQKVAWAVRKTSPELLKALNKWFNEIKNTSDYYTIYNRYFKKRRSFARHLHSKELSIEKGVISQYDGLLKKYAKDINWDWRFLASMVFQESRFKTNAKSWAGARGLFQMMPEMAKKFGAKNSRNPEQSVAAGVAYIAYLQNLWKDIPGNLNRTKFVLASYNAGENHIEDARRVAELLGKSPNQWE
ncbi:MAG: transporter substrate-binding domain-containing protein, partial [candidate division Zixibacteria bacterium]|nr:transporter substrate-binding domain-containing protein [candidate division Zixibacteria bacterium]